MSERSFQSSANDPLVDNAAHLQLMRVLEQHPEYSQRQLSRVLGVSLGKTHYLLKALLAKGWVKAQNFQRSDSKLGYLYVLTRSGVSQRMRLTQAFLARKEAEYQMLQAEIATLKGELADRARAHDSKAPSAELGTSTLS
jgi:EPS-associated MarR family transcriptional regulator